MEPCAYADTLLRLDGAVQHYDWGGLDFIAELIGEDNPDRKPFSELWIGAHPGAPSLAATAEGRIPLNEVIASCPNAFLGGDVADRFASRLPYLFKVLDARQMLSIQAHPSKAQAEEGFARENAAGIPAKAANRNYKDDNHKPEVHVALTDFWMLHGFRPLKEIADVLGSVPEFNGIMPGFSSELERAGDETARRRLLKALYGHVMALPQSEIDSILNPLLTRLQRETPTDKDGPDYWALRAANVFPLPDGHRDRGILSIYLLNLVHLKPGQGTYQPAGMLHAYLEGVNVELMANSDNVLRGGLTPKHVDVSELMQTLTFESGPSQILEGEQISETERVYRTEAAEFELSRIEVSSGRNYSAGEGHSADALITVEGAAVLGCDHGLVGLERGKIAFAPAGLDYFIAGIEGGDAVLFKASVPR